MRQLPFIQTEVAQSCVATRITLAASVGIPAASMCIVRRLYHISKIQAVATTYTEVGTSLYCTSPSTDNVKQKRRAVLIDTSICVLFPILCLPLGVYP